ncbi:MAG: hypothetical protein L6R39_006739 [Caloplaca ligustica]|nr:MAG: hypothetical protein L6R39_006739 [Caloplaca ligustica]
MNHKIQVIDQLQTKQPAIKPSINISMLFNSFIVGTMLALASALPQAPLPPTATGPAPVPSSLGGVPGTSPNFRLIESHHETAASKNHFTNCWNGDMTPTPKDPNWQGDMLKCLDQYDRPDWDGQDCGGVGWFKAKIGDYQNPQNCFDACRGCFNWFIDNNSTNGYCWTVHGDTEPNWTGGAPFNVKRKTACNTGYH